MAWWPLDRSTPNRSRKRSIIPRNAVWQYLAGSEPPENWTALDFEPRGWKSGVAGFGYGDGDDRTELDMKGKYTRVYIRKTFSGKDLADVDALGLMVSYDDGFIAYLNGHEIARGAVSAGRGAEATGVKIHETEGFDYFAVNGWRELIKPGNNVLALEGHNVEIDSSDFSLHAYLAVGHQQEATGQAVDAWDANSGRRLWQIKFRSTGTCLNGPAGCAGDGLMFFTGGGESSGATGETMAIEPRTGKIAWRTAEAFASQTGTPSFQDGRCTCPVRTNCRSPAFRRPMAVSSGSRKKVATAGMSIRFRWARTTSPSTINTTAVPSEGT